MRIIEYIDFTLREWAKSGVTLWSASILLALGGLVFLLFFSRRSAVPLRFAWWRLLSRLGNVQASVKLAAACHTSQRPGADQGRRPRNRRARKYLKRAARARHAESALTLGKGYVDGTLGRVDLFQAEKYLRIASEEGLAEADYHLGLLLEHAGDIEGADESIRRATKRGYTPALGAAAELAERHLLPGIGREAVLAAYRQAAKAGIASAAIRLSELLTEGRPVTSNFIEALTWLQSKSCRNDRRAQFLTRTLQASGHDPATVGLHLTQSRIEVALACWHGKGTDPDWPAAWRWANLAAESGDPEAIYLTGKFLLEGVGVIPDPEEACKRLETAARRGHHAAQFELARQLSAMGSTGPELEKAYAWAAVAALNGEAECVALREELSAKMDRAARSRAIAGARALAGAMASSGPLPASQTP